MKRYWIEISFSATGDRGGNRTRGNREEVRSRLWDEDHWSGRRKPRVGGVSEMGRIALKVARIMELPAFVVGCRSHAVREVEIETHAKAL